MAGKTLYDKLWDDHLVSQRDDGSCLIYIDRQLLHEVTSPQAFEGLRLAGRRPWRVDANIATPDHNVPTSDRSQGIADAQQVQCPDRPGQARRRLAHQRLAGKRRMSQRRLGRGHGGGQGAVDRDQPPIQGQFAQGHTTRQFLGRDDLQRG